MLTALPDFFGHAGAQAPRRLPMAATAAAAPFAPPGAAHPAPDDRISLSADARRLADASESSDDDHAVGESAGTALVTSATDLIHKALNDMRRDIGALLKGVGFSADAANDAAKAFVDPVLAALKDGADFNAKIMMVAAQQTTVLTGNGFSQSFALVAKALEIEVNHTTGRVSISVASVSLESYVGGSLGDTAGYRSNFNGAPVALQALISDVKASLESLVGNSLDDGQDENAALADTVDSGAETAATLLGKHAAALEGPVDGETATQDGHASGPGAQRDTAFRVDSVETYRTMVGHLVTRLRLDALIPLTFEPVERQAVNGRDDQTPDAFDITV